MNSYPFLNFVFLQIYTNRGKYLWIFVIATLLIMIFSSFIFISNSISNDIKNSIKNQTDFTVQKIQAGKVVDIPNVWLDQLLLINGITQASYRVYGKHFYEPAEHYFTIVGIDFYDEQIVDNLKELVEDIDINLFLDKQNMIIGNGVKKFLDKYHYFDYYNFRPPNRTIEKVYIYNSFPKQTNIVSSDMIIMDINLARKILGIDQAFSTDIIFNVPNIDERETVKNKIRVKYFDTRIIQKEDLFKIFENFFNYKSGLFMILYIIVIITFVLILYQRYTYISNVEKKEIAILKSLGWSIKNIILLKITENSLVFIFAFILGINLGYFYVFNLDAPLLSGVFLGFKNLPIDVIFTPVFDFGIISMIFFVFIIPIIASILIPVWKISIIEPYEAMR